MWIYVIAGLAWCGVVALATFVMIAFLVGNALGRRAGNAAALRFAEVLLAPRRWLLSEDAPAAMVVFATWAFWSAAGCVALLLYGLAVRFGG